MTSSSPAATRLRPGIDVTRAVTWIRAHPLLVGAIAVGLLARIFFWAYTGRVIDDAMITVKHAKNVADGVGLTHHLGEGGPVHGFTSVLSVMVPIPGELIGDGGGLVALRLVSLGCFVAAIVAADAICRHLEIGTWPRALVLAFLALDQNQIFFGMAGMETQIATAVLLVGIYYVLVEDFVKAGALVGLALLARPDFVLWVAPAYLYLLIRDRRRGLQAVLIGAAFVVPWLIFATGYFGSPVPNTIIAKSQAFGPALPSLLDPGAVIDYAGDVVTDLKAFVLSLRPFHERAFLLSTPVPEFLLNVVVWAVAGLALIGGISTWRRPSFRPAIAFVVLWLGYKTVFIQTGYFEWYGVPIMAVMVVLAAAGLTWLSRWIPTAAIAGVAAAIALAYAIHIPFSYPIEERTQHGIEDQVRDQVGRYLGEVTEVGETMTSEPAGYVGYYTNATLLDYPGLTSRTATETMSDQPRFADDPSAPLRITELLRPDWLILRPAEWAGLQQLNPEVAAEYTLAREFKTTGVSTEQGGLEYFNIDTDFLVLRHTAPPGG